MREFFERRQLLLIACSVWFALSPARTSHAAEQPARNSFDVFFEESAFFLDHDAALSSQLLLTSALQQPAVAQRNDNLRIDASPMLEEVLRLLGSDVVWLRDGRSASARAPFRVAASFRFGGRISPVRFHLGEESPEPLGAFYAPRRDISWAFIWPLDPFTLRLEGGDRSEFGNYAIAGAHWHHRSRPLAAGLGVPMRLRNAEGEVGVVFQFRMTFE